MDTGISALVGMDTPGKELRGEDFAPWSYNLHSITTSENWDYPYHRHFGCFELVFIFGGRVEHHLGGEWREYSSDDLLAVGEEDFHAVRGRNFSYANLIISLEAWNRAVSDFGVGDPLGNPIRCAGRCVRIPAGLRGELRILLDKLFLLQQTTEGERLFRRMLGLLFFEAYWEDGQTEDGAGPAPIWWTKLEGRLRDGGDLPANPGQLAEWAGRSREHVARTCRRIRGTSPSAWINELRLERAAVMLRKSNREIAEIAFGLGFGSLEHFYRLFRAVYGVPPGRYRRTHVGTA